jgi:hypothetical protein
VPRSLAARIHRQLGTVVEESDETEHWLLVLIESEIASGSEVEYLYDEACQLRAIFKASHDTARGNGEQNRPSNLKILKS